MAGFITPGGVEHIHTRWTRCVALEVLHQGLTKLTKCPERTKPIRYDISLDTWYHTEPHGGLGDRK